VTPTDRVSSALDHIAKRANLLAKLGPDLLRIIETDARNSSTRDGYPGGGNTGPRGNTELTPTEAAASQRMGRRTEDEYHRAVMGALDALERTIVTLNTLTTLPDRIANIQRMDEELERGNDSWCWIVQQLGLPYDEAWTKGTHRTTLRGKLSEPRTVCRWVADWYYARGVLPTETECKEYLERAAYGSGHGVKVHVDPKKGRAA